MTTAAWPAETLRFQELSDMVVSENSKNMNKCASLDGIQLVECWPNLISQMWWNMPTVPALGKRRQEDQKLKVILCYIMRLRSI